MVDSAALWTLEDFIPHLDIWIAREDPSADLRIVVTHWVLSRAEDPYQGVKREPELPNLWFGGIPETVERATVVACSYWIFESTRSVRCNSVATLNLPL